MASGSPISPTTEPRNFVIIPLDQQVQSGAPTNLHPYTRPLTISDLESCVALENAAFSDPNERASREKVRVSFSKVQFGVSTCPYDGTLFLSLTFCYKL
jgi:hypothetical protein